jgi:hypothetical protein
MKDFALVFRQPPIDRSKISPKDLDTLVKKWQDWIGGLAAQGKFNGQNTRLDSEGKVLKAGGVVTDGPFVEIREILGGILVVHAENLDEATTLAHGCPALDTGGSVEIRPIYVQG